MKKEFTVSIEVLKKDDLSDFICVLKLFEEVFEMRDFNMPNLIHLQRLLYRNDFQVFVARSAGSIIGGLTIYELLQYYSQKPLAYIFDLAVDKNYQRQGVGKKLIAATKKFYNDKGFEEVFVQADQVDDYAIDFYRKTSPSKEDEVVHFYYQFG